jgi:hypothetical protein
MPNWMAVHVSGYGKAFNAFLLYLQNAKIIMLHPQSDTMARCTLPMETGRHLGR